MLRAEQTKLAFALILKSDKTKLVLTENNKQIFLPFVHHRNLGALMQMISQIRLNQLYAIGACFRGE